MLKKTGSLGERLVTLCAVCFCAVILLQNLLNLRGGSLLSVLVGLLFGCGLAALCLRYLRPFRGFSASLFVVRFALALCFILWLDSQPVQDFQTMYTAAGQLACGSHDYLSSIYFFNWAYQSAFVAYQALVIFLFGNSLLPLQILNAVWMAGTTVLVYKLARCFLSEKAAMTAGVLYCFYPAPLFLSGVLTNQHLSVFLLYSALYLLLYKPLSPVRALLSGALLAVGNAIRPIGVIVMLAAVLWLLLLALRRAKLGFSLRGLCVAVSYFAVGAVLSGLIVSSGINPEGLSNNQPMWKFVVGLNQDSSGRWNQADYDAYLSLPTQQAQEAMKQAVQDRLSVGPIKLAGLAWRKSAAMWAGNEDLYWGFGHMKQDAPAVAGLSWNSLQLALSRFDKGIYLLAFAFAFFGLLSRLRKKVTEGSDPSLLFTLLLCGYYGVHLIVEVQSRYRYFLMPCVFILAAMALSGRAKSKRT